MSLNVKTKNNFVFQIPSINNINPIYKRNNEKHCVLSLDNKNMKYIQAVNSIKLKIIAAVIIINLILPRPVKR